MADTADIVIIGGGIIGLSIAYQTARRSDLRIVVCEKGAGIGEGSTGYSSAITRQRYTHESMVRIARDGNNVFRNWAEYTGLDNPAARFNEIGVVWMTGEPRKQLEEEGLF
ncbi:MAG: FAD-binding oxidoreductase [Acidobacteria bacterium]|nr:FAD-binding oxidoreductase [Acidobacteriota bacterium]